MTHPELILILDYGSQYSQLIARRVRELGVYSELHPYTLTAEKIRRLQPKGIILSGSPYSTYEKDAPISSPEIFDLGIPVLGICYGLQLIGFQLGGKVDEAARREYGHAEVIVDDDTTLFAGFGSNGSPSLTAWMSHGDHLTKAPRGFVSLAHTGNSPICAIADQARKIYAVQFHPEVVHTPRGTEVLSNFLFRICTCTGGWNPSQFIGTAVREIRQQVGKGTVICALSGGVDSSVAAVLLHEAIGGQLRCIHINNGLMRAA